MELNFKLPPLQEENQRSEGSSSSSSCLTCVRLQRRIRELQEKLSQDKEAPTVLQPNQDLQRCKSVQGEKEPGCKFQEIKYGQMLGQSQRQSQAGACQSLC